VAAHPVELPALTELSAQPTDTLVTVEAAAAVVVERFIETACPFGSHDWMIMATLVDGAKPVSVKLGFAVSTGL